MKGRHVDDARLHAYVAGEADPTQRAVIDAHVDRCARCREALGRVTAVARLIERMAPAEPDELSWRRMQERVRRRLESEAESGSLTTLDLFMGRRWVTAGIAAVAAVALLVWFAPPRSRPAEPVVPASDLTLAQTVTSGDAPMDVKLVSGAELRLGEQSRVIAPPPSLGGVDLQLDYGTLDVRLPQRPTDDRPYLVETPAFATSARSRDFTVGYRADGYVVAVRDGVVDVEGDAFGGHDRVTEGERREIRVPVEMAPAKRVAPKPVPPKEAPREVPEIVSTSSEGETSVQVMAPNDPVTAAWRLASRAYYRDRDLEGAIAQAEIVVAESPNRAEARLAGRMICEARIALEQPEAAVEACARSLRNERDDEELRSIHYMLATIYRTQLSNCRRANEHYEQVLVYGRQTLLDDEARLFRAGCALDLGDLNTARRDIRALAPHAARLSRPAELRALETRLQSASDAQDGDKNAERK